MKPAAHALDIECLNCGAAREEPTTTIRECPRCGYLGWAPSTKLTENDRRTIRTRYLHGRGPALLRLVR